MPEIRTAIGDDGELVTWAAEDERVILRLYEGAKLAFTEEPEDISHLTNDEFIERLLGPGAGYGGNKPLALDPRPEGPAHVGRDEPGLE